MKHREKWQVEGLLNRDSIDRGSVDTSVRKAGDQGSTSTELIDEAVKHREKRQVEDLFTEIA